MAELFKCEDSDGVRASSFPAPEENFSTIEFIECPHRVPPGYDPEKWDEAMKNRQEK